MKRVLITGANSYVGTNVEKWLLKEPDKYHVETLDMKDPNWKDFDFSKFDVVIHVAGIVHIKETRKNRHLYYEINRDLAYQTALKAKKCNVKQFIFLSSMSVYGIQSGVIDRATPLLPKNNYGKSKVEAEVLINKLQDDSFCIVILRPPMVYGKGCNGNYPRLSNLAMKMPFFPNIINKRSIIYIDNLSEFIKKQIDNQSRGLFFPQNSEYANISKIVRLIAECHGKQIKMIKFFNPLIRFIKLSIVIKVFGDLVYKMNMSNYEYDYRVCSLEESIYITEMEI